jgi:hypothetical protein
VTASTLHKINAVTVVRLLRQMRNKNKFWGGKSEWEGWGKFNIR